MFLWPWEESKWSCNIQDWRSCCCSTSTNACAEGGACEHNGWIQTACFGVRRNDSRTCVTLEPIMRNTHKLYFFCARSHGPLWGSKSTDIWGTEKGKVWAESSIMMTMFRKALVSSSHRTAKTVDKPERISTCIYQEAGHITACQASLKYVNVLMLFHWETTIWGSLDWWHVQMDWNYVQFVFFHSGSFESVYVTEGYLHILCGNADCLCGWLDLSWLERLCYSVLVQCSESYHGRSFKGFYNEHSMDLICAVKRVMLSVRDNETAAQFLQLPKRKILLLTIVFYLSHQK